MASRRVEDLIPSMQVLAKEFAVRMASAGIPFVFTCTKRTQEEQDKLYAQGRTTPGQIVTWTHKSKHIEGKAFDIAIVFKKETTWSLKVDVNANHIPDYEEAGRIGESLGLVWGGRWSSPDYPHYQIKE